MAYSSLEPNDKLYKFTKINNPRKAFKKWIDQKFNYKDLKTPLWVPLPLKDKLILWLLQQDINEFRILSSLSKSEYLIFMFPNSSSSFITFSDPLPYSHKRNSSDSQKGRNVGWDAGEHPQQFGNSSPLLILVDLQTILWVLWKGSLQVQTSALQETSVWPR